MLKHERLTKFGQPSRNENKKLTFDWPLSDANRLVNGQRNAFYEVVRR
ncbi:hypothetical protein UFOVP1492_104 [uncultured Caudovirales phage]|uniref:Uncharacterized protein n=1 Tax=uncultured Caudovirales phage TaxID=2100421 RepID=A0A6J7XM91_9CAUD|nr:hypothetical protein UFOVP1127_30 [uncultured Caudovirales phage]CAB4193228.1 hypothetical protein UFOVP1242_44 [uncultured Caudovirales phage]CAB4217845.1 hypothetical protein UFOVP1492_104 [uncultured Caudovirales phage]CAB5231657.1 hypothetical protein UFOVP1580_133 [uncultured Caudovirales phage]